MILYKKKKYNALTVPCQKSKIVSFAASVMKKIVALSFTFTPRFRFQVKLICCIVFGSASSACCLLK